MEEKIKEFEEYRKEVCKKANKYYYIGIAIIVVGIVLMMLYPLLVLVCIVGGVYIGIGSSMKTKLSNEFKSKFVVELVKEMYPDSVYQPTGGIPLAELLEPGLLTKPDRYTTEDYLKAEYDGVPFEMCDFDFKERRTTTDGRGHTTTTYVTYAKGRYMIFDFKREFTQTVKVVENTQLGVNTRGLEKIETESVDFNKKFKTYSSDPVTAFYVLTPQIQLKLLELESKFKGSIYFAYLKGKMYVVIADGVSILNVNASKPITHQTYEMLESQLILPASVINELGLADSKFNEGDAI